MKKIKLQIASLRRTSGMTQQELGDKLGVSFQTVSKWENHVTMPDITMLPELAEIFGVTVDALLGLTAIGEYRPVRNSQPEFWGQQLEYLKKSRKYMWNEDYLHFLVEKVWKIGSPVRILDCGCAYGALGLMLLPLLPTGSTYTGLDHSPQLLDEGRKIFAQMGIQAAFVETNILNYTVTGKYDLVVSQAVLRHSDCAEQLVNKMSSFVKPGGLVVCIDCNREFEESGVYLDGTDYADLSCHEGMRKLWKTEWDKQGRDFAAAMKAPHYMRRAGLKNVDVRMNDRVTYLAPDQEGYGEKKDELRRIKGWEKLPDKKQLEALEESFINRGMEYEEVQAYIRKETEIYQYFEEHPDTAALNHVWGFMISYGWK